MNAYPALRGDLPKLPKAARGRPFDIPLTASGERLMDLRITPVHERRADAALGGTMAIFGVSGVGTTSLVRTLPERDTLVLDFEGGLKSVRDWRGDSIVIRSFEEAIDVACLIGRFDPGVADDAFFSEKHYLGLAEAHPDLFEAVIAKRFIFMDSLTALTRLALTWAKKQPASRSARTGGIDTRAAYGLLGDTVVGLLRHLHQVQDKTVIMTGRLMPVTNAAGEVTWEPLLEGRKVARELPGIVDHMMSLSRFSWERHAWRHDPDRGVRRHLICQAGNRFGLPAKDRSGRLCVDEWPRLDWLLSKINGNKKGAR